MRKGSEKLPSEFQIEIQKVFFLGMRQILKLPVWVED